MIELREFKLPIVQGAQVEGEFARFSRPNYGGKVIEGGLGHAPLVGNDSIANLEVVDVVLVVTVRRMDLKKGGVGVSLLKPGEPCTLAGDRAV